MPLYRTDELPLPVTAIRYYLPVEICTSTLGISLYHYCCCSRLLGRGNPGAAIEPAAETKCGSPFKGGTACATAKPD